MKNKVKNIIPGLIIAVVVGIFSMFLGSLFPTLGSATIAIFLGIIVGNLFLKKDIYQKGYKFAESDLLSYSIVLLGATLSINTIMEIGLNGIIYIVIQMTITIFAVLYIGKMLGFTQDFRYLMASGNAVCGSSAIAATSSVIDANDKDRGITITITNVIGIVLMFILPLISKLLYNNQLFKSSALIGGILQSVGEVIACGAMINEEIKEFAMIFKIMRVILLIAVVFIFGHLKHKTNEEIIEEEVEDAVKGKIKIPWYVIGFFVTCALFSLNIISNNMSLVCKTISNKLEIIALAGIGLRVDVMDLIKQGKVVTIYSLCIGIVQVISAIIFIFLLIR